MLCNMQVRVEAGRKKKKKLKDGAKVEVFSETSYYIRDGKSHVYSWKSFDTKLWQDTIKARAKG